MPSTSSESLHVTCMRRVGMLVHVVLFCLLMALIPGCSDRRKTDLARISAATDDRADRDHFQVAIDFLRQRDLHNLDRSAGQTQYYLNRWVEDQAADPRWMIDRRLINTLPDAIRRSQATKEIASDKSLSRLEFRTGDVLFMEECRWLHNIATWVSELPPDDAIKTWINRGGLPRKTAENLAKCAALFDWTISDIQLEPLLPYPKQSVAGPMPSDQAGDETADWPPPMRGVPGPGYSGFAWHVLLYGRGDMYQRARVFILLARQLRVDVVMLGIDTKTGRARPWLPAVLLDKQLYLFDTELGLPIPGPGGEGIATLAQVRETPELLESLDVGSKYRYRVRKKDLDQVVALIDASPNYLTQRMTIVEQNLDAANQMILAFSPTRVKQELQDCEGIKEIRLWAVPFEAVIYQQARTMLMARVQELRWQDFIEHGEMQGLGTIVKGRRQYFLGNLDKEEDNPGAAGYYMAARMPDNRIKDIATNERLQKSVGLVRSRFTYQRDWDQRLHHVTMLQIKSKQNASYWMGLMQIHKGNYQVAANWLKQRTLDATPDGPWTPGARYNLARCYEALGKTDEARQLYLIDESPQRHGSLLRARSLKTQTSSSTGENRAEKDSKNGD